MRNRIFRCGRHAALVMVVIGAVLGHPALALAQQGWSEAIATLSAPAPGAVGTPQLAVDAAGNATAVWLQGRGPLGWVVQAARFRPDTGTWTPPVTLSSPCDFTSSPRVTADGAGNALVVWGCAGVIEAVRYSGDGDGWGSPIEVSARGQPVRAPRLAMDAAGNAVATWSEGSAYNSESVQAAYYTAATSSWGGVVQLTAPTTLPNPTVAIDAAADAVAVFVVSGVVHAARYTMLTGAWSSAVAISQAGLAAEFAEVDVDPAGNAMAVWARAGIVQAARFVRASDTWTVPTDLSLARSTSPAIAIDPAGNAIATWARDPITSPMDIETARYSVVTDTWSGVTALSVGFNTYTGAAVAVDDAGNAIAAWSHGVGPVRLHAVRYVAATDTWSAAAEVSTLGPGFARPAVHFDGAGTAQAIWFAIDAYGVTVHATRWLASPAAPTIGGIAPSAGKLAVQFGEPVMPEPAFAATNYAYSLDNGLTWTSRDPASTASPLVMEGLPDFTTYVVRLRALNSAGPGAASTAVTATVGPVPGPPIGLIATSIIGNTVTIAWTPPIGGPLTGYVLEGGLHPGEVLASLPTASLAPAFTFIAPTGAFYIRVHAVAGALKGPPSNEIRIFVRVPAPPSAPAHLRGLVNGSAVSLSWTNTWAGGVPTGLWLSVSGPVAGIMALPLGESFTYGGVPPGTYTLRVIAVNATGVSAPSNPVTLTFPGACSGVPAVPTNFVVWTSGTTIVVSWNPPAIGPAVTGYTVLVSGAYFGSFQTSERMLSGTAGPGSYTLRVAATNACGTGPPTPAQMVLIP